MLELVESIAENDDELLESFWKANRFQPTSCADRCANRLSRRGCSRLRVGRHSRTRRVQPPLDAVVDYPPSPLDVPETHGVNPDNGQAITRKAADSELFSALAFKIMADLFVGQLTFIRVYYRRTEDWRFRAERAHHEDGAHWAFAEDAW